MGLPDEHKLEQGQIRLVLRPKQMRVADANGLINACKEVEASGG